jgi:hypothetical protein
VSQFVYKKALDTKVLDKLEQQYSEKLKAQEKKGWGYWFSWKSVAKTPNKPETSPTVPKIDLPKVEEPRISYAPKAKKSLRPTSEQIVCPHMHLR